MKAIFSLFLLFIPANILSNVREQPTLKMAAEIVLELDRLAPPLPTLGGRINYFDRDESDRLYFCDMKNHRIVVYTADGKYISQIGSVGQGDGDLFYPCGIAIQADRLYVLDQGGKKIKIFSLDGTHRKTVLIKDVYSSDSLGIIENGLIAAGSKYLGQTRFKNHPLITIFNPEGIRERSFGDIYRCENYQGYIVFNLVMIGSYGETIVAAHTNAPRMSSYDLKGKKIFDIDLSKMKIPEVLKLKNDEARMGMDTPDDIKSKDGSITSTIYCSGLSVDPNTGTIFYTIKTPNSANQNMMDSAVLMFNPSGKWLGRLHVYIDDCRILVERTLCRNGYFYGVGRKSMENILFRIPCSNIGNNIQERR